MLEVSLLERLWQSKLLELVSLTHLRSQPNLDWSWNSICVEQSWPGLSNQVCPVWAPGQCHPRWPLAHPSIKEFCRILRGDLIRAPHTLGYSSTVKLLTWLITMLKAPVWKETLLENWPRSCFTAGLFQERIRRGQNYITDVFSLWDNLTSQPDIEIQRKLVQICPAKSGCLLATHIADYTATFTFNFVLI